MEPLETAAACAMAYLSKLDAGPVGAVGNAATLRKRLAKPLSGDGVPAEQVIRELVADVDGGLHAVSGGRFSVRRRSRSGTTATASSSTSSV